MKSSIIAASLIGGSLVFGSTCSFAQSPGNVPGYYVFWNNTSGSLFPTWSPLSNVGLPNEGGDVSGNPASISVLSIAHITTGTLGVANGGTGATTTPSNGQIPIGNGTKYVASTLTAGSNVTITNSAGGITISSTGGGANLPSDYISGLVPSRVSGGSFGGISVSSGSAMIPGSPNSITVSGAGTSAVNGTYTYNASFNTWYLGGSTSSGYMLVAGGTSGWSIYATSSGAQTGSALYSTVSGVPQSFPSGATWTVSSGIASAPTAIGGLNAPASLLTLSSPVTWTPSSSPTAIAFYYLYLTSSGALAESQLAPIVYQGTAMQDLAGDRYLGAVLTDSGGSLINFIRIGNEVDYRTNLGTSQFAVLNPGSATSATSVSCSSCVPATSQLAFCSVGLYTPSGSAYYSVYFGETSGVLSPTYTNYENVTTVLAAGSSIGMGEAMRINLSPSQAFLYSTSSSGCTVYIKVTGYEEMR